MDTHLGKPLIDPSYKQYDYLTGLDAIQISGIDPDQLAQDFVNSGTVNESEGWVTGFDPSVLQTAQSRPKLRWKITSLLICPMPPWAM